MLEPGHPQPCLKPHRHRLTQAQSRRSGILPRSAANRTTCIQVIHPFFAREVSHSGNYDSEMPYSAPHARNLRKGRHSQPGTYYFLTTTVAGRRKIFTDLDNAITVLDTIRWLRDANRFAVDAAVVMPDHLHLIGQLGKFTLARTMHTLKSYSARRIAAAGVATPVWQKGYYDHALRDDEDYRSKVQYVLENPVRAGLVSRAERYPFVIFPGWWG